MLSRVRMSSSDLRDRMDGLQWDVSGSITKLETIMPGSSIITYSRGENVSRDNISQIIEIHMKCTPARVHNYSENPYFLNEIGTL